MANADDILTYLSNNKDKAYCDDCLSDHLRIEPRQQVNQICRRIANAKQIQRVKSECSSCANYKIVNSISLTASNTPQPKIKEDKNMSSEGPHIMKWQEFEDFARQKMSEFYRVQLAERQPPNIPKRFDMVSSNGEIVGDAKFLTLVRGKNLPPAKYMEISGHVWLLEHVGASSKFLVFGNQRQVPEGWLRKYGKLVKDIDFFFLSESGKLTKLN